METHHKQKKYHFYLEKTDDCCYNSNVFVYLKKPHTAETEKEYHVLFNDVRHCAGKRI